MILRIFGALLCFAGILGIVGITLGPGAVGVMLAITACTGLFILGLELVDF